MTARTPNRIRFSRNECITILRDNGGKILDAETFDTVVSSRRFFLSWDHGKMGMSDDPKAALVAGGVFVQLWNLGIDAGDAARLARSVV